jgi:hypothetical protein
MTYTDRASNFPGGQSPNAKRLDLAQRLFHELAA